MDNNRAVVFANGDLVNAAAVRSLLQSGDTLVAADGGYLHMKKLGLQPHLLIGDLDSLPAPEVDSLRAAGVELEIFPREKDATDLELALVGGGCGDVALAFGLPARIFVIRARIFVQSTPRGSDFQSDQSRCRMMLSADQL